MQVTCDIDNLTEVQYIEFR